MIALRNVTKRFGGQTALDNVTFDIGEGLVHALAGGNGAGKSTLIKLLTGVHQPDEGYLLLDGKRTAISHPVEARNLGIAWVHQQLDLIPTMAVRENLFLTVKYPTAHGRIRWRELDREAESHLNVVGLAVSLRTRVDQLSPGAQHLVAVARMLVQRARVLILDEPTAALGDADTARVLEIIGRQRSRGATVIFVTHRLDEILRIADVVTVLRDGHVVATVPRKDLSRPRLVEMLGGSAEHGTWTEHQGRGKRRPRLVVEKIKDSRRRIEVDLVLHEGEIVGLAGLVGSGRSTLAKLLTGMLPIAEGSVILDGVPVRLNNYRDAVKRGIVLIPEDRHQALVPDFGLAENVSLGHVERYAWRKLVISASRERAAAAAHVSALRIKQGGGNGRVRFLSGGNQQKVVLARALDLQPKVLILDEPTAGIDIATKQYLYGLVQALASQGMSILFISSELEELPIVCDRIVIYRNGRTSDELPGNATRAAIIARLFAET